MTLALRWGWLVSTTPRPLYPRERPGTCCTGGWVGPRAGLDGCGKSRPHRDSIPGPSSPWRVAIPTVLSRPIIVIVQWLNQGFGIVKSCTPNKGESFWLTSWVLTSGKIKAWMGLSSYIESQENRFCECELGLTDADCRLLWKFLNK